MSTQTPSSVPDTTQLRAELREITDEKSLLDDIEGDLERNRFKEDDERAKKRKQEDTDIVRKREIADRKREARQEELCERETAIRTKLKACKLVGESPYLTPPAASSVRSRDDFENSNSIIPSTDSGQHGTNKRPRTGEAVPATAFPLPPVSEDNNADLQTRERVSLQKEVNAVVNEIPAVSTKRLQDIVPLPRIQSLPPAEETAHLPTFVAMPSFTREFISEYIGGSNSECGLLHVGKEKRAVQIVECSEYLVLKPALNPYIPSAPGQHFAFLDLQRCSNFEGELNLRKVFPVFLSTGNGCWSYSGHYRESIAAEMVTESTQRQLVSETMLDKWVGSLFARSHYLSDLGLKVLLNSGLYSDPSGWKAITKEKVKLAIETKKERAPYTLIPFWFRFLQCVAFDHTFHKALVGKKLEIARRVKREP